MQNRERWVADTLVELADTLVPALDPKDYWLYVTDRYAQLVPTSSVRLAVVGDRADRPIMVHTDERLENPPLARILAEEGPGVDCRAGREPVVNVLLDEARTRWKRLAPAALSLGFRSVHAFPFSRREDVLGDVTILTTETAPLPMADLQVAVALADAATIGMLNHRAIAGLTRTSEQLQVALDSRVIIEQAKGIVSAQLEIDPGAAFRLLRRYARSHNRRISDLCELIVTRRVTASDLVGSLPRTTTRVR
ncbi:ANTAR domain-containing protein [Amycolatopsis decaplanina]|uniref:GAF domain-containing protein n=1 Tax=Amycolatopsis decaplanina DSM 44594 TaxID=1284240 RepID=M2WRK3_9PSEU|nr:ANTAR domain-containing protein [Amycolatopsis decaplanina]EME51366.1 GAF domain-containing protein [Amycolatopsis decaplanina DSM 44594]